jgi:hypothetical protein
VPFNAVVLFGGGNLNRAEASMNGAKFQFDSFGEDLTPNPSPKERGALFRIFFIVVIPTKEVSL